MRKMLCESFDLTRVKLDSWGEQGTEKPRIISISIQGFEGLLLNSMTVDLVSKFKFLKIIAWDQ